MGVLIHDHRQDFVCQTINLKRICPEVEQAVWAPRVNVDHVKRPDELDSIVDAARPFRCGYTVEWGEVVVWSRLIHVGYGFRSRTVTPDLRPLRPRNRREQAVELA